MIGTKQSEFIEIKFTFEYLFLLLERSNSQLQSKALKFICGKETCPDLHS